MVLDLSHNNVVNIYGKIISEPVYNHEIYGEKFFEFLVEVSRLSNSSDKIKIMVSERLIPIDSLKIGKLVNLTGQFRSYNNYAEKGNKLILTVFAKELSLEDTDRREKNPNQIYLDGFICKKPIYRTTPFGREITDILIAVNRSYNKSDYIPCISWGRNAKYSETLNVGDNVRIWGRIQSREYQKRTESGETEYRIAYEVSITRMEITKKIEEQCEI